MLLDGEYGTIETSPPVEKKPREHTNSNTHPHGCRIKGSFQTHGTCTRWKGIEERYYCC